MSGSTGQNESSVHSVSLHQLLLRYREVVLPFLSPESIFLLSQYCVEKKRSQRERRAALAKEIKSQQQTEGREAFAQTQAALHASSGDERCVGTSADHMLSSTIRMGVGEHHDDDIDYELDEIATDDYRIAEDGGNGNEKSIDSNQLMTITKKAEELMKDPKSEVSEIRSHLQILCTYLYLICTVYRIMDHLRHLHYQIFIYYILIML